MKTALQKAASVMSAAGKAKPSKKRTEHCRRIAKRPRTPYKCNSCGHRHSSKYINAMIKAGFALRHLSCKECGQRGTIFKPEK